MPKSDDELVMVDAGNGVVVWHRMSEWLRLINNVDLEAAREHDAPLELEHGEDE